MTDPHIRLVFDLIESGDLDHHLAAIITAAQHRAQLTHQATGSELEYHAERTYPVDHPFDPQRFAPDRCAAMLARYPCNHPKEEHPEGPAPDRSALAARVPAGVKDPQRAAAVFGVAGRTVRHRPTCAFLVRNADYCDCGAQPSAAVSARLGDRDGVQE